MPGWNEIDAVGLRDKQKKMHWAVAVESSTTYAPPFGDVVPAAPAPADLRVQRLEAEVQQLKASVQEMKASIEELKKLLKEKDR